MEKSVIIDLVKLIRQVWPQLPASQEREMLLHWLDRLGDNELPVEIDLAAVQPAAPGRDIFCPRCGYDTVLRIGEKGYCKTCHLSWTIDI